MYKDFAKRSSFLNSLKFCPKKVIRGFNEFVSFLLLSAVVHPNISFI